MFMKKRKLILFVSIVALSLNTAAMATITLDWQNNPYGTYQVWAFDQDPGFVVVPGGAEALGVPADPVPQSPGLPTADIYATDDQLWAGWYPNMPVTDPGQGIVYGGRVDFDLHIPNEPIPEWLKIIQVEVVYWNSGETQGGYIGSLLTAGGQEYLPYSEDVQGVPGTWQDVTIEFRIPQDYFYEDITVSLVDSGVYIDLVEVATICVPEPATIAMLGLGAVALLRKRKA
jgi:hypothetical protein